MGKFIKTNSNNAYSQRICHFNDGAMRLNHRQTSYSTLIYILKLLKCVPSKLEGSVTICKNISILIYDFVISLLY